MGKYGSTASAVALGVGLAGALLAPLSAHAAIIQGSFTAANVTGGTYSYDLSTPFAFQDGYSAIYAPVSNGSISFTYRGKAESFAITEILVAPTLPDGHLSYEDAVGFDFGDNAQLQFIHTPAGSLASYALSNLDLSQFMQIGLFFSDPSVDPPPPPGDGSDGAGGTGGATITLGDGLSVVSIATVPEAPSWTMMIAGLALLAAARRRRRDAA